MSRTARYGLHQVAVGVHLRSGPSTDAVVEVYLVGPGDADESGFRTRVVYQLS